MSIITKKKILFITHEMTPYHEETDFAKVLNQLAVKNNEQGYEVRVIMPRFGTVNERRHRLHEVVRLSGLNINVNKEEHPLIIKVASLPNARLQVYFMDNEDLFKRKFIFHDADGKFYDDNSERMLFFCKGALETVKKFGWPPDVIVVHGWMSGIIPTLMKTHYKNEPVFEHTKVVYSVTRNTFKETLGKNFLNILQSSANLKDKDAEPFKDANNASFMNGGAKLSDMVIMGDLNIDKNIVEQVKPSKNKKVLNYDPESNEIEKITDLINKYLKPEEN
jgi:starch synthase